MKKKILLIAATHGDERVGLEVIENLKKKGLNRYFDYFIGNPRALKKGTRFVDADLNRSYPGRKNSATYERRLARRNLERARRYDLVVDIHEAKSGINDFIIISREEGRNFFPLDFVNLGIVLYWPSPKGPLGQFLDNSIELEFGMKGRNRRSVVASAVKIVAEFLERVCDLAVYTRLPRKRFYYVYGKVLAKGFSGECEKLRDFRKTVLNGEEFYPLLVGQYVDIGIICYKMRLASL